MSVDLEILNEQQKEAVMTTEGPLLILAGAGAGKTKVLTHRIAYLIEEKGVAPYNIMAITFTNKAAAEMKERVDALVDFSDAVWVMTFHATCVRILRRHCDRLGYESNFTIYDTDDQKTLVRHILKDFSLDTKQYKERDILSAISSYKNEMLDGTDMQKCAENFHEQKVAEVFIEYDKRLKKNNAMDFDDLLTLTVRLFRENEDILENYQNRFRYIMVDEYQDTNQVQFELVWLLSKAHKNLCVVGDDDQSIYRFRGADIRNILEFEDKFPGTKVIKLEQNYRSTTHILDAANAVISNNQGRKEKHLWSDLGEGATVKFNLYQNGYREAEEVLLDIQKKVSAGTDNYRDFAILYRTNAQSRTFEEKCVAFNIPYRLVGGVNFYQRAEIKDLLAYIKTIAGGKDDLSTERILNVPKRGIGQATVDKLKTYAAQNGISLMETIEKAAEVPGVERAAAKLAGFSELICECRKILPENSGDPEMTLAEFLEEVLVKTDYYSTLDDMEPEKADVKRDNLGELLSKAKDFEDGFEEGAPTIAEFLEEVSLVADIDSVSEDDNRVLLMTIHSAKGLEFPTVYLTGMEDGLFPSYLSICSGDQMDMEEERRLAYVGITRAMRVLKISAVEERTAHGQTQYNPVSRFVKELPADIYDEKKARRSGGFKEDFGSNYPKKTSRYQTSVGSSGVSGKPNFGKEFKVEKLTSLSYGIGDRVAHVRFGEGTVLDIIDNERDFEVVVNFDTAGEKHMFASFAKLKKV